MNWYWRVRIYNEDGQYWHGQIETGRDLREIADVQKFYELLTGCKMLIEGMSETKSCGIDDVERAFTGLWTANTRGVTHG